MLKVKNVIRNTEIDTLSDSIIRFFKADEEAQKDAFLCAAIAELDKQAKELDDALKDAKKRVKLTLPQSLWQEFGISDKK